MNAEESANNEESVNNNDLGQFTILPTKPEDNDIADTEKLKKRIKALENSQRKLTKEVQAWEEVYNELLDYINKVNEVCNYLYDERNETPNKIMRWILMILAVAVCVDTLVTLSNLGL